MPRRKKQRSLTIDKAQSRQAALLSISPKLDFGNGLTSKAYDDLLTQTRTALTNYNTKLSDTDQAYNDFQALEKTLADMADRMLTGIATQYGKNSSEYEKAGGTRKSERKRPRKTFSQPAAAV